MVTQLVQSVKEKSLSRYEEQLAGFFKPIAVDTLPSEPRAPINMLPPPFGSHQAEPHPKQRQRFIDNEVRRDQRLAGFERSITRRAAPSVGRVRRVGARHPASRVDE